LMARDQAGQCLRNLFADTGPAARLVHLKPVPVDDAAAGIARDELQFGAADFDAEQFGHELG
jgi:hypothetical protein